MKASAASVRERAEALLARIRAVDAALRCYVAVDEALVLRDAERLDAVPASARGPLHGMALAVKDLIDVAGLPTRAGSSFFRRDAERDAPVAAALRAAGALVIGKTNTHEFAWGITTDNPHFGRTGNAWDPARIAGGSSGGSAAAVAAGLADIALGTDTIGSIRIPAALNGICGIRPATGTFSLEGIVPLAAGLDTVGPFAHDVATLRAVYDALAGARSSESERGKRRLRACRLRGGRWDAVDPAVASAMDVAAAALRDAGTSVDEVRWWDDDVAGAVGVVQQHAAAAFHAPMLAAHPEGYGEDVRAHVRRAMSTSGEDARRAHATIARARTGWDAATAGYDVALAPVCGDVAPRAPAPRTFRDDTIPFVAPASGFGLPVVGVPIGFGADGLPLGMQIIATQAEPAAAFDAGLAFQRSTGWHLRRPAIFAASS
ncbi:MAG TPA: amidase [Candidatus Baltobacteraceae bacterium]|nr:amidase [Candidatus Baltobacteraceae bacterium]